MVGRHSGGAQHCLQLRNVQPEDGHRKGEYDGRDEIEVLRGFARDRRVLEDAETAGPDGEQGEPLAVVGISIDLSHPVCREEGSTYMTTRLTKYIDDASASRAL